MIKFKNNTPFETSISIYGSNRLLYSELSCTKELTSAPSFVHWFTEWIKILYNGPTYKSITFCIEPWSDYTLKMQSNRTSSLTMGFNDVCTNWKKHVQGIYEWNSKNIELDITCVPNKITLKKHNRGPMIAQDIPLKINIKSDNDSWKVTQKPITTVQYSPTFDYAYYEKKR
tara:strand:+ start:2641 stop:3156 length:516 start_codon:yes stop_codon:yes gene_type:complete